MKYQEFKKSLGKPYFSVLDIALTHSKVYNYQLSLWLRKGYIGRLKRGLYFFVDEKEKITPQEVSFLLYEPSYLSLESMLSYYGLIPEVVYAHTAVATKTTRKFSNEFGDFIYHHIHPRLFFGYSPVELAHGKYLAADPEKAVLDYFYFNLGKIKNRQDIVELRINGDEFNRVVSRTKIYSYLKEFNIKKLDDAVTLLFDICSPSNN